MTENLYTGSKWGTSASLGSAGGVVTWSFNLLGAQFYAFDAAITIEAYRAPIRAAFDLWEKLANIDFKEIVSAGAQIQLGWDSFGGPGSTLGEARWSYQAGLTLDAEVAFDISENWSVNIAQPQSLFVIAVHEIGHAIGLDHSEDLASIMYPYLGAQTLPSAVDIAAISALYGPALPSSPSVGNPIASLVGTDGNDNLTAGNSYTSIAGGGGADTISASSAAGQLITIYGGRAASDPNDSGDAITIDGPGSASVFGNGGDDVLTVRTIGAGTIYGGVGNDTIRVENGASNQVFGGPGTDTIAIVGNGNNTVFGAQSVADPTDAADNINIVGNGNNVVYSNGGDDRVTIIGSGGNTVYGGVGNDTLAGGNGNDWLFGGPGDNVYTGGAGADRFVHSQGARDIVTDFSITQGDRVELGGQPFVVTTAGDGSAALLLADGGVVILHNVAQADFSFSYIA